MENVIAAECFREPQEGDDFVPCPIVWSGECGCASNYRLHESLKNAPVILWLAPDIPTPTPHLWGEQQCHEWTTYPHKTLPKKKKNHTHLLHKKRCTESEYSFVLLMCIPVKNLSISPIAHNSQFGSFHRRPIFLNTFYS